MPVDYQIVPATDDGGFDSSSNRRDRGANRNDGGDDNGDDYQTTFVPDTPRMSSMCQKQNRNRAFARMPSLADALQ